VYGKGAQERAGAVQMWAEKQLLDYNANHERVFGTDAGTEGIEKLLSLALTASKIVTDVEGTSEGKFASDRRCCIMCSMKSASTIHLSSTW
jgi:hypothetical protein